MAEITRRGITAYFQPATSTVNKSPALSVGSNSFENIPSSSLTPLPTQEPSSAHGSDNPAFVLPSASQTERDPSTGGLAKPRHSQAEQTPGASHEPPTQSSTVRSSQRITVDGEERVLDSDQDSDASLQDLDEIIYQRKVSSSPPLQPEKQDGPLARDGRFANLKRKDAEPLISGRDFPKFSLQQLVDQSKIYATSKADNARIEALIKTDHDEDYDGPALQNSSLVQEIMQRHCDDDDDMDRIKRAIVRTEVLHEETAFSFFHVEHDPPPLTEFPRKSEFPLSPCLSGPINQEQSFLNGFVEHFAEMNRLPGEVVLWMLDAAYLEHREDLRQSYISVLRNCPNQLSDHLSIEGVKTIFQNAGVETDVLSLDRPAEAKSRPSQPSSNFHRTRRLLDVLHALGPCLDSDSLTYALSLTCRMAMDISITSNAQLQTQLDHVLNDLLRCLLHQNAPASPSPYLHTILTNLYKTSTDPSLRILLLRNVPNLPSQWLEIRRRLALSWFLASPPTPSGGPTFSLSLIEKHLSSSNLHLTNATNFSTFTSLIQILDFALDSCGRPPPPHPSSPSHHGDDGRHIESDRQFDRSIDALAARLKTMFLAIVDAGASDLRRTEAKEALEALRTRLRFSVRIRPPEKRALFWEEDEQRGMQGMKKAMEAWIE